jgi:hypothetical protein
MERTRKKPIERKERCRTGDKVKRLSLLAVELRKGGNFPVTRLTVLKSLCQDPVAAAHFGVHLTRLASKRMKSKYRAIVNKAVKTLTAELKRRSPSKPALYNLLDELVSLQNERKPLKWGSARIIQSKEALLAENTVNSLLRPAESSFWGYQIASQYAQRYDSRYPWPLIPSSAPLVEDIVEFWRGWQRKAKGGPWR